MNSYIKDEEIVDVRDIAEAIREAGAVLDDHEVDEDERSEAYEAIRAYGETYAEASSTSGDVTDWEDLADAWDSIGDSRDTSLIRSDYFEEYVKQMAEDIGAVDPEMASWVVIDWSATADNVKMDYTEYDLAGTTYYLRD